MVWVDIDYLPKLRGFDSGFLSKLKDRNVV
jgi:hypothetical protein